MRSGKLQACTVVAEQPSQALCSVAPRRSLGSPSVKAVRRGFRRRPHTSHSMGFAFSAVVYASGYIFLMFVAVCLGARRAASSVTIVESEVLP